MITVNLIIAETKRREQLAKDAAERMKKDPSLAASMWQQRGIANAMRSLRLTIEAHRNPGDCDSP